MSGKTNLGPLLDAIVYILILAAVLVVLYLIYYWTLRPFLRTLFRARKKAQKVFYGDGLLWGKTVLTLEFTEVKNRRQRAAIRVLYWLYSSWLYSAFRRMADDLIDNMVDIIDKGTDAVVAKEEEEVLERREVHKNEKKGKKIVCEHGKVCKERFSCKRATPMPYMGENRKACSVISDMVELKEYEPTSSCPHVRCAAACLGKCSKTTCQHYSGHEITDNCLDPQDNDECVFYMENNYEARDVLRKGLVHCIIADSTVDINLSFKIQKTEREQYFEARR